MVIALCYTNFLASETLKIVSDANVNHNSGEQKIITKNGIVSFTLGEKIDYEVWGSTTSTLALVFVKKGGSSGTLYGGCGAGSSFIEIVEEDLNSPNYDFNKGFKDNLRTEIFGDNKYEVYDWRIEPSIKYYEIYYNTSKVRIVYRPEEPCIKDENYQSDLETLLKTFYYEGSIKTKITPTKSQTKVMESKPDIIMGIKITPGIDRSVLDEDLIGLIQYDVDIKKLITTRQGCVSYAQYSLSGATAVEKARGQAIVNACIYYLEN